MKAVFSFWSKPHLAGRRSAWMSEAHHLYSWSLALHAASQHYPTSLITDDEGKRMLVDELGLAFDECSVKLNALADFDPGWWALGKLYAYWVQQEPFVHLDSDVYLWKRLPERLEQAPVFAQNPQPASPDRTVYRPKNIRAAFGSSEQPWFPEEWAWYEASGGNIAAAGGATGGQRVDFLSHYGRMALTWLRHPGNRQGLAALEKKSTHMPTLEEWFLEACVHFHRGREGSPFKDIAIDYLFPSARDAWNERIAHELGYTHLIGGAKRNPRIAARLEERVRKDLPELYKTCREVAAIREGHVGASTERSKPAAVG